MFYVFYFVFFLVTKNIKNIEIFIEFSLFFFYSFSFFLSLWLLPDSRGTFLIFLQISETSRGKPSAAQYNSYKFHGEVCKFVCVFYLIHKRSSSFVVQRCAAQSSNSLGKFLNRRGFECRKRAWNGEVSERKWWRK